MSDLMRGTDPLSNIQRQPQNTTILQQVAPHLVQNASSQPDLISSSGAMDEIESFITSKGMNYSQAKAFRDQNQGLVTNTYDFQNMVGQDRGNILKLWSTKLPHQTRAYYENLDPEVPENQRSIKLYNDYKAIRSGEGEVQSTGWDAFGASFIETSVVGGIGFGIVDLVSEKDLSQNLYGDDVKAMEAIMLESADKFDHEIYGDYKTGKMVGIVSGIITDIASTIAIGGGAGGAASKLAVALGESAQAAVGFGTLGKVTYGAIRAGLPAVVAGVEYSSEVAIRDLVTGHLDSREDLNDFASRLPGTFATGMVFGAVGEAVGGIFNKAMKARTARNIEDITKSIRMGDAKKTGVPLLSAMNDNVPTVQEFALPDINTFIGNITTKYTPAKGAVYYSELIAAGYEPRDAKRMTGVWRQAHLWQRPMLMKNDDELQQAIMETGYGAKFTREGKDMIFTEFDNQLLPDPVRVRSEPEFYDFMKNNITNRYNQISEDLFIRNSPGAPVLNVKVSTAGAIKDSGLNIKLSRLSKTFGAKGPIDLVRAQDIADEILGRGKVVIHGLDQGASIPPIGLEDLSVYLPNSLTSGSQSRAAVASFFDQLATQGKKVGKNIGFDTRDLEKYFGTQTGIRYNKNFLAKMKHTINIEKTPQGFTAALNSPEGTTIPLVERGQKIIFATEADAIARAGKVVHLQDLNGPEGVIDSLIERGHRVTATTEGRWNIKVGDDDWGDMTMDQIFDNPVLQPKLSYEGRPSVIHVRDYDPTVTKQLGLDKEGADQGWSVMQYSDALRKYKTRPQGYVKVDVDTKDFTVHAGFDGVILENPSTGFVKTFDTGVEAADYLQNLDSRWNNIWNRANDVGYSVTYTRGGYVLSNGVDTQTFTTKSAVENYIGRASQQAKDPLQLEMKEVVNRVKREMQSISNTQRLARQDANKFRALNKLRLGVTNIFEDIYRPLTSVVEKSKNFKAIKLDRAIGRGVSLAHNAHAVDVGFINSVEKGFSDLEGEFLHKILAFEADPSEWGKVAKTVNEALGSNIELNQKHVQAMVDIRTYFDHKSSEFGIPSWKAILNYAPAVKAHGEIAFGLWNDANAVKRLLSRDVDIPNEMMPYFMNMRNNEITDLADGVNIFDIMKTYSRIGNRTTYMNPLRQQLADAVDITGGKLPEIEERVANTIALKLRDAFGASDSHALTKQIDRMNAKHAKANAIQEGIGKYKKWANNPERRSTEVRKALLAETPTSVFSASIASSLMGMNLRLPIRNLMQIQTHTAPVVGIKLTEMAMMDMVFNPSLRRSLKNELIQAGTMKAVLKGQTKTTGGKIKEISRWTQALYKASDDQNRLITAHAAGMRFDGAIGKLGFGAKADDVLTDLRLHFLSGGDADQIMGHISKGEFATAKNIYRDRIVNMTQFDYNAGNNPRLLRGVGKIFGAYGSYPMQTFDLWRRGTTTGTLAQKTAFAATGVGMTFGVGVMMNEVLELGNAPYTPVGNVTFFGGPYMDVAPNFQRAFDQVTAPGMTPEAIAKSVWQAGKMITPVGQFIDRSKDAVGMYQDGEINEALIRIIGGRKDAKRVGIVGSYMDAYDVQIGGDAIDMLIDLIPEDF